MDIPERTQRIIEKNVKRLTLKNTDALSLCGSALRGAVNGGFDREVASRVFDFNPACPDPIDAVILQSLLTHLAEEDIEEIFRRYARRRGLVF